MEHKLKIYDEIIARVEANPETKDKYLTLTKGVTDLKEIIKIAVAIDVDEVLKETAAAVEKVYQENVELDGPGPPPYNECLGEDGSEGYTDGDGTFHPGHPPG